MGPTRTQGTQIPHASERGMGVGPTYSGFRGGPGEVAIWEPLVAELQRVERSLEGAPLECEYVYIYVCMCVCVYINRVSTGQGS